MDDLLADRLREAEVDPKASSIAALEEATGRFLDDLVVRDVPDLLRLACSKPLRSDYNERFRQHFRTADEHFPLRDEDQYVSIVALNALVQLFHQDSPAAVFGALAARCARFARWDVPHPDLYKGADAQVQRAGVSRYPSQHPPKLSPRRASLGKAMDATTSADPATLATAIAELFTESQRLRGYSSSIGPFATGLVGGLAEQVRIMWWLLSGWSETTGQRLDELAAEIAPAVLAMELAQMTGKEPGPPSSDALLHQALLTAGVNPHDQISLAKCSKALAEREIRLPATPEWVNDLTLVLSALNPDGSSSPRRSIDTLFLARETYDELLLIRVAAREESEG